MEMLCNAIRKNQVFIEISCKYCKPPALTIDAYYYLHVYTFTQFINHLQHSNIIVKSKMSDLNPIVDYNPATVGLNKLFGLSKILSDVSGWASSMVCNNAPPRVEKVLFSIGAAAITYKLFNFCYQTYHAFHWLPSFLRAKKQTNQQNLKAKYGDCYVVVTGCTEGIGLAFVIQLAKMGFSIVMVARNRQKLQRRIVEIKGICPTFKHEKVIGDLSKPEDIKRVAQELVQLSKRIDIGIVINNAGLAGTVFKNFIKYDEKSILDILTINFEAVYEINSKMIPILRARHNRSAIINVSSCCGVFISQGNSSYTASKVLLDIYSRTLSIQNRDRMDILSVRPFGVSTSMLGMQKNTFIITPKDCAFSSLADLGHHDQSWSGLMHKIEAVILSNMTEQARFKFYDKVFSYAKQ